MSTKEFGCFFCDGKSTDYSGTCNLCNKPINIGKELLKLKISDYKISDIIGRGFYGWTLKAEDNYQRQDAKAVLFIKDWPQILRLQIVTIFVH